MNYHATVYSRPGCQKCHQTVRVLTKLGVPVTVEQIDDHPDKQKFMQDKGWQALPLVEWNENGVIHHWHDFSHTDLMAVKAVVTDPA